MSGARARGLGEDHVRHVFIEAARQVLAAGGSLAYGGDLRANGYTQLLLALVRTYSRPDRPPRERILQYLAAPVWRTLRVKDAEELAILATPIEVPPADARAGTTAAARARDYTAMRVRMTAESDARIVLGGRLWGRQGRWPGVVEEAYLALRRGQPLFVLGGLGGAANRIGAALRGTWPDELTEAFQLEHTEAARALADDPTAVTEAELRETLLGAACTTDWTSKRMPSSSTPPTSTSSWRWCSAVSIAAARSDCPSRGGRDTSLLWAHERRAGLDISLRAMPLRGSLREPRGAGLDDGE